MIIMPVKEGENIERALKKFKRKYERTGSMPEGVSARKVFNKCIEMKVAAVIGDAFYPNGKTDRSMRVNYSNMPDERIIEGIKRMAKAIKECM